MIDFDLIERLRQEIKRSQKEYQTILRQITSLQQQEEKLTRRIAALKELVKTFNTLVGVFPPLSVHVNEYFRKMSVN